MLMKPSFAIATMNKADIILIDEWLSVGDENFRPKAEKRLLNFISDSSILILASHSKELLNKLCTKIIYL